VKIITTRRIDLAAKLESYFQIDQSLEKAGTNYCLEHFEDDYQKPGVWIYAFSTEIENGKRVIIAYWREDSYSYRSDIYGEEKIPMEDLMPYLENQWKLDEFDRKLANNGEQE